MTATVTELGRFTPRAGEVRVVAAVRIVLRDARGIFIKGGFVTSFITKQVAPLFPQMNVTTLTRKVRYALNYLEGTGEAERVETIVHHDATGKDVPVTRWRRPRR